MKLMFCVCILFLSVPCLSEDCGLNVWVVDAAGNPIPHKMESFVNAITKDDFAKRFESLRVEKVPCGTYSFSVSRADFNSERSRLTGKIHLIDRHQWMTLLTDPTLLITKNAVAAVDSEPRERCEVRGHLKLPDKNSPVWIRLISLDSAKVGEVEVVDGSFGFRGICSGQFVVAVVSAKGILAVEPIDIKGVMVPVELDLDLTTMLLRFRVIK